MASKIKQSVSFADLFTALAPLAVSGISLGVNKLLSDKPALATKANTAVLDVLSLIAEIIEEKTSPAPQQQPAAPAGPAAGSSVTNIGATV